MFSDDLRWSFCEKVVWHKRILNPTGWVPLFKRLNLSYFWGLQGKIYQVPHRFQMTIEMNIASFYLIGYSNFTFQSIILGYQCTSFGGTIQLTTNVIHRLFRRAFFSFQQERKVYIFDEFSFLVLFFFFITMHYK